MPPIIKTEKLTKFYGEHVGIQDLDLEVSEGEVFGLLGPNGAGKTTTIRLLMDFLRPTSGSATVFGFDSSSGSKEIRRRTGYLPGDFTTYKNLTASDVFDYFSSLRGAMPASRDELCDRFDLDPSRKISELSRGNRQKVGLIQAYMSDPDLLALDEPTTGLDPLLQSEFQRLVAERKAAGATQLVSSHLLPEIEAICDRVCIVRHGKLVAIESIEALQRRSVHRVTVTFESPVDPGEFERLPGVQDVISSDVSLTLTVSGSMNVVIKAIALHTVSAFESHPPTLEEIFLAYYGEAGDSSEPNRQVEDN